MDTDAAAVEEARRRRERRFEVVATLILAASALLTAWSGYQASLWGGIQSTDYSKASALRVQAAQQDSEANQYRLAHLSAFNAYLQASAGGNQELAQFYAERFPEPLKSAFDAWLELDPLTNAEAPITPLTMPQYALEQDARAAELNAAASATFQAGEDANSISDVYTLATVLLATALFFSAISERFEFLPARVGLLTTAGLALIGGLSVILTQPVTSG